MSAPLPDRYVVDTNVAVLAFAPDEAIATHDRPTVEASRRFLLRAANTETALHVPWVFFSEAIGAITKAVGGGMLDPKEGETTLATLMGLPWLPALPAWSSVYQITRDLGRKRSGDSEFIALALALGCPLVTADDRLRENARQRKLEYPIVGVLEHPWGEGQQQRVTASDGLKARSRARR